MRRHVHSRSKGQALVEFAFVFPIIAVLAFAFIDIGRAVFTWNTLTNAAREAARVAAVNQLDPVDGPYNCRTNYPIEDPANPGWTTRGCAMSSGKAIGIENGDVSITFDAPPDTELTCSGPINVDCLVTVTVQTQFTPITPVAGQLIGPIAMSATSTMPVERLFP
jgi:hypothetical protein